MLEKGDIAYHVWVSNLDRVVIYKIKITAEHRLFDRTSPRGVPIDCIDNESDTSKIEKKETTYNDQFILTDSEIPKKRVICAIWNHKT